MKSPMTENGGSGRTVTITIVRQTARVPARHADKVIPVLERFGYSFEVGGPTGCRRRQMIEPFYAIHPSGRLVTSAGLVPRIRRQLQRAGLRVRVRDNNIWPLLRDQNVELLDGLGLHATDLQLLRAVGSKPLGQLVVNRPAEIPWLTSLICDLFPTARIFLVTASNRDKHKLRERLETLLEATVETDANLVWGMQRRLYLDNALTLSYANPLDWNLLIFLDVNAVVAKRSIDQLARLGHCQAYCFRLASQELGERDQLWLEATCGPVIFRTPSTTGQSTRPSVVWVKNAASILPRPESSMAWKRALWHHAQRNALLAHVARALQDHDRAALQAAGLSRLASSRPRGRRVWILTESHDHAELLAALLPGWDLLHAKSPASQARVAIATMRYGARGGLNCDLLVRADGGPGWPAELKFPCRSLVPRRAWLIDLLDEADESGRRATDSRLRAYRQLGWLDAAPDLAGALATKDEA
jgi:hypothetical protein